MKQESTPLKIGDIAPPFALRTAEGREVRLTDVLATSAALVVFIRGTW
jgi:peroxiredoxin